MDKLIESIKLAVGEDPSSERKRAGAEACRAIIAALEAEPGQALAAAPAPRFNVLALDTTQILDLLIGRLRAAVPTDARADSPGEAPAFRVEIVRGIGRAAAAARKDGESPTTTEAER